MFKFVRQNQHTCSWNPALWISRWWHWTCWKGHHISQSFRGKSHYLGTSAQKSKAAHPVNYFPGFLGKNIKNCPPSLLLFTSLLDRWTICNHTLHHILLAIQLWRWVSVAASRWGMSGHFPPVGGSSPTSSPPPPLEGKYGKNSYFRQFFGFLPPQKRICPPNAHPQLWCHHVSR